jgi:sulfite exporter TauE/SafE
LLQGFLHCSGMCGPFVMAFSLARGESVRSNGSMAAFWSSFISSHLMHNLGRIVTFVLLGFVFGLLGSFVNTVSKLNGLQALAGFIGGGLMLLWAFDELRTGHGAGFIEKWSLFRIPAFQRISQQFLTGTTKTQSFLSGIVLGFHPCGLLFAILLSAAATGSAWLGASVLLVFGIGTVPALLTVALLGWYGRKRFTSKRFSYVAAGMIALSGVLFILRGMAVNGWIPGGGSPWLF